MKSGIIGYICTINGEPAAHDTQLVYACRTVAARVYPTREAAERAIERTERWREKRGFEEGPYFDVIPLRKARS